MQYGEETFRVTVYDIHAAGFFLNQFHYDLLKTLQNAERVPIKNVRRRGDKVKIIHLVVL
ncbi:MAG: hypothetical protein SO267_01715 [Lachnospiraceae bacterium]|nr:hypothetical protein [Lachnospiraceae bacterium]MDY4769452.1 hypothetical protein [Lachnospiraceae bacterium]